VQGAMRIAKPDNIELEYVQMMMMWLLFNDNPRTSCSSAWAAPR
jgi:spermidine synthase